MSAERTIYDREDVIANESEHLTERRRKLFGDAAAERFEKTKFGIALSGGGIRSAIINLGFLKTLNLFNIIKKADYLSTVSGGGYTGSYIQATLKSKGSYNSLFETKRIDHMRSYGNYFIPGQKSYNKRWNSFLLVIGYLGSFAMSLLSLIIVGGIIAVIYYLIGEMLDSDSNEFLSNYQENKHIVYKYGLPALLTVVGLHFLANISLIFNLRISKYFTKVEAGLVFIALVCFAGIFLVSFDEIQYLSSRTYLICLGIIAVLFLIGFVANPNGISFHRFYRNQLADSFLNDTGNFQNVYLKNLCDINGKEQDYLAPYPLINTCLNIQSPEGDDKIKGAKASDYFLLSPLHCGAKLTKYVKTATFPGYKEMTLPAATTISAAAVNPGMGIYSNSILSFIMTLFNARLGFWVNNPLKSETNYLVWWPTYFFKELFANINTKLRKVNISDGGHIENLAVYELLRRRCRLIIAVDAGADPNFTFMDLENLAVRARNELGIDIHFRVGHRPEECIKPKPSSGYSEKRYAIADLYHIWDEFLLKNEDGSHYKVNINGKEKTVEVLVNYTETDGILKFKADVKLRRGTDVSKDDYLELQKKARRQVQVQLDKHKTAKGREKLKFGTLVYVKSAVTSPKGKPFISRHTQDGAHNLQFDTYKYKIYHPDFPHEPTSDQFFDPVQWEAYFQLGQFIGADVLNLKSQHFIKHQSGESTTDISIEELIACFDENYNLFEPKLEDILEDEDSTITTSRGIPSEDQVADYHIEDEDLHVGYEM